MNIVRSIISHIPEITSRKSLVYVALGDSTVEGVGATSTENSYPSRIARYLSSQFAVEYYNLGIRAAKSNDLIKNQLDQAIALNPDLVTISIGANDIFRHVRLREFEANLTYILSRLQDETHALVVINTIPNFSPVTAFPKIIKLYCQLRAKKLNVIIRRTSYQTQTVMADMQHMSMLFEKKQIELMSSDGLHPSDKGYELWAVTLLPYIDGLLPSQGVVTEKIGSYAGLIKPGIMKSFLSLLSKKVNTLPARLSQE